MISLLVLAAAAATTTAAATPQTVLPPTAPANAPVRSVDVPAVGYGAPPTKQELAGDPNQTICKRIATTGTRFASNDCRTRAEWNQLAVDSRQATNDMRDRQGGLTK